MKIHAACTESDCLSKGDLFLPKFIAMVVSAQCLAFEGLQFQRKVQETLQYMARR